MWALGELFVLPAARMLGWVLIGELVGFFLLKKFGQEASTAAVLPVLAGGLGYFIYARSLMRANLPWLMGLPYSKRQMIAFNYSVNLAMLALGILGHGFIVALIVFVGLEVPRRYFHEVPRVVYGVFAEGGTVVNFSLLFYFMLANAFCFLLLDFKKRPVNEAMIRSYRVWALPLLGASLLAAVSGIAKYFDAPIVWMALLLTSLCVFPTETVIASLSLASRQRRLLRATSAALSVALCGFMIGEALHDRGTGDAERISQSAEVLGRYAGRIPDESLVRGIAQPKQRTGAYKVLADLYRAQRSKGLTVQVALTDKTRDQDVAAVLSAFDPSELKLPDLLPLFVWLERKSGELSPEAKEALYRMVKVPLDAPQVAALLDSPSRVAHEYVLVRSRYYRGPQLLEAINARLSRMEEHERAMAADTIAVLRGGKPKPDQDRAVASDYYPDPDCGQLEPQALGTQGSHGSEPLINVCLRKLALERGPGWVRAVEYEGWISWPLDGYSRKLAKSLLSPAKNK